MPNSSGDRDGTLTTKEPIPLNKARAKQMLETAREYVGDGVFVPMHFEDVDLRAFLRQYLWVIYVSGFRNAVVEKHFDGLRAGFHDLDLEQIAAMKSVNARTLPIRNQRKADAFLRGCKLIHREGWRAFKDRLREQKRTALWDLPWMGSATTRHMALALASKTPRNPTRGSCSARRSAPRPSIR